DSAISALYIIGDFGDSYGVGNHGPKNPGIFTSFKEEIESINAKLDEIDVTWPDIKKVYIEGNHEYRFERFLHRMAPELYGVLEIKLLLRMDKRPNWTWVDFGPRQLEWV